ncbi:MAG TPA: APC family permease [Flavobacteriaceae bacterium]|nr:APC family permease [Flavobacteriaceae bacterium]HQU22307.1 APC family permease [Flavobacteriaceae bacterium]HQU66003.1 APC family permease [Flavobacteriaceae bacterium]HRW44950.1 APC family permease [Flavobacteriaceae bacterium]
MKPTNKKIGLLEAMSIGIGGMVGGGIFAVLGLAVSLSKGATPLAFLLAGLLALITSYSYIKLSLAYPDRGGTVKFINQGFGKTLFSGALNNLLWVSYIIMLSLYASAFGSYAPNLHSFGDQALDFHLYASGVVVLAAAINYFSIQLVGRIESYAVVIKLLILIAFVGVGLYGLFGNPNLQQLSVSQWESPLKILTGGMVIFLAYEGFELIANAVPDLKNPKKLVPRAYLLSVLFVLVLYMVIAAVTVASLPFEQIAKAQDYVLAEAAKPQLGTIGFTIITVAALISTFSAINASLYGGSRVSYEIAEDDELPHQLTFKLWNQPIGLFITTVATLVLSNFLKLESISTAGSVGFLVVFAMVNWVGYKKATAISGNKTLPLLGTLLCLIALGVMLQQEYGSNQEGVFVALSVIGVCVVMEWIYKKN